MYQTPLADWPLGLEQEVAFFSVTSAELARRSRIAFAHAEDGLDEFDGAVVTTRNGTIFALQDYAHSPVRGTKLILMNGRPRGLAEIVEMLGLRERDIGWVAPDAQRALSSVFHQRAPRWRLRLGSSLQKTRTRRVALRRMRDRLPRVRVGL